jgi:hypothetical protein
MSSFFGFCNDVFRKRSGKSFRKTLGLYNYKIGYDGKHKQPGRIPIEMKNRLRKVYLKKFFFLLITQFYHLGTPLS